MESFEISVIIESIFIFTFLHKYIFELAHFLIRTRM